MNNKFRIKKLNKIFSHFQSKSNVFQKNFQKIVKINFKLGKFLFVDTKTFPQNYRRIKKFINF